MKTNDIIILSIGWFAFGYGALATLVSLSPGYEDGSTLNALPNFPQN